MTASSTVALPVARSEMNVTPMLDVLLVLLVIFMAAAVGVHRTVDAQLPEPCPGICDGGTGIVLEVRPGPTYAINAQPVSAAELRARLTSIYISRPEKILQVAGHAGVPYEQVITAMDVARGAGVRVIGVMKD